MSYVNMVCATLRHSIPKSIVYCQVREAKRSLLDFFYTELGKLEVRTVLSLTVFSLLILLKQMICVIDWSENSCSKNDYQHC